MNFGANQGVGLQYRNLWWQAWRFAWLACGILGLGLVSAPVSANQRQVTLAGLAYAGDAATLDQRFPFSREYEKNLLKAGSSSYLRLRDGVALKPSPNFEISTGQIAELKGRDETLVTTLLIDSETVSLERFGNLRKLLVLIRGQALFFDFKTMTVVRSYPLSFAYVDVFDRDPSHEEILQRIVNVYEGTANRPGMFSRYSNSLGTAALPTAVSRYLRVARVALAPEVLESLPPALRSAPGIAETWAADLVAEAISTRVGVPLVPFVQGYAVGQVMPLRVSDGTVFQLKLPSADYEISVDLTGLRKVKFGEVAAGVSYVYGAFARVKIEEPLSGTVYLDTELRNGESKVVPATQTHVDDFPAYYDAVNGLFRKLADSIAGKGNQWVKSSSSSSDIDSQIRKTKEMMDLCR